MSSARRLPQPRALVASVGVLAVSPLPLMMLGPKPTAKPAAPAPVQQPAPAPPAAGPQRPSAAPSHGRRKRRPHRRHRHHRPMRARLTRGGRAIAPAGAPKAVRRLIKAANRIALKPYVWGGGHGGWRAGGYDCSGSLSYALHGAGLLRRPMTSGALMGYGHRGRGHWITIYANGGHTYMLVAGLRFDTSSHGPRNSRWTRRPRSSAGYVARHPRRF